MRPFYLPRSFTQPFLGFTCTVIIGFDIVDMMIAMGLAKREAREGNLIRWHSTAP
jgi:hypothetical protein